MWSRNRPKSESSIYRRRCLKTSSHQARLPCLVSARSAHSTSFNAIDTSRSRVKTPQNSWSDWPSDMENNKLAEWSTHTFTNHNWLALATSLLEHHYDPAYARSQNRLQIRVQYELLSPGRLPDEAVLEHMEG